MPSSNSSRHLPSVSPFLFPSFESSSSVSVPTVTTSSNPLSGCQPLFATSPFSGSSFGSGFAAYSSSTPAFGLSSASTVSVPTVTTSNPLSGCQPLLATVPFSGSSFGTGFPSYSSSTPAFGLSSASTAFPTQTSAPPSFPSFSLSSSSSASTAFPTQTSALPSFPSFSLSSSSSASTAFPTQTSAPPSFPSFSLSSSSSLFSASSAQPSSPFETRSIYAYSVASAPAAISSSTLSSFSSTSSSLYLGTPSSSSSAFESSFDSFGSKRKPSASGSGMFSSTTPSSFSFQSTFGYKSATTGEASDVSTAMTSSATTMMPASLDFATSSAPSISSTVTIPGVSLPAVSTTPFSATLLFSSQAAGSTAYVPSVPVVTGVTTSLATNASTSASKSTIISSATNSPSPFPSFSMPTKISTRATSSQPQSTTSASMPVLVIKDGMERMQLEKSDLVEVGVQSDLPAHKVNQVASSEIVRPSPSEAEPCMERMQAENPDLEVGVQSAVLADTVNQVAGSEIVRTGPEGVPHLDKVVDQLETSARPVDALAEYRSTEDQPMDQSVVQSTPVNTVREFEATTSFQEGELNRIFLNLFVCVEGFLVPKPYVELYKKILRRYGHMATTEVLTDCPLGLIGVATEVMRLFEEMASCTKADLSEDLLRRWDFRLSSAESLKFKVDWLRQRLEEVKSSYRHQIENADAIEAVRSSLAVTESNLTDVIARREDHLKEKQAAEASLKAAEAALATVNATLQQDDEEISVFESEKLGQLVKLCVVEGDFMPGVTLASDLL